MSRHEFVRIGQGLVLLMAMGILTAGGASAGRLVEPQNPAQAAALTGSDTKSNGTAVKAKGTKNEPDGKAAAQPSPDDPSAYKIGVEDELQISVWHEPELSMPVQVRPDGMITLPLVNDVSAVGLTTKELQTALTEKLGAFVNEPQVTVIVKTIKSRKVFVVGQVAKPGTYVLVGKKTALQAILEAGGLGPFAKSGSIVIVRTVSGQQTRLKFNYKKAVSGKAGSEDIELEPGDMIVVP